MVRKQRGALLEFGDHDFRHAVMQQVRYLVKISQVAGNAVLNAPLDPPDSLQPANVRNVRCLAGPGRNRAGPRDDKVALSMTAVLFDARTVSQQVTEYFVILGGEWLLLVDQVNKSAAQRFHRDAGVVKSLQ